MTNNNRIPIMITVECEAKLYHLKTFIFEYRSLMALIFDNIITDDFGDCKGTGRCGTCLVEILNNPEIALQRYGNEVSTIKKLEDVPNDSRLACQIQIDNNINGLQCRVVKPETLG